MTSYFGAMCGIHQYSTNFNLKKTLRTTYKREKFLAPVNITFPCIDFLQNEGIISDREITSDPKEYQIYKTSQIPN